MIKNLITTLGVLVALLPFLSIPGSIKGPLFIVFGITIAVISYQDRHNRRKGFIGDVIRRGRKVIDSASSPTLLVPSIDTDVLNRRKMPENNNDKMDATTNQ